MDQPREEQGAHQNAISSLAELLAFAKCRLTACRSHPIAALNALASNATASGINLPQSPLSPHRKQLTGGSKETGKRCNCKNSKCLKLYCECFASGKYCSGLSCTCQNCANNQENEAVRQQAIESIIERNPEAFRPKILSNEGGMEAGTSLLGSQGEAAAPGSASRHLKGCACKRSNCLKKYCECYQGGIFCSEICKCIECRNFDPNNVPQNIDTVPMPSNLPLSLPQTSVFAQELASALRAPGCMEGLCSALLLAARSSEESAMEIDRGSKASTAQQEAQEKAVMAEFSKFLSNIVSEVGNKTSSNSDQVAEDNRLMSVLLNS